MECTETEEGKRMLNNNSARCSVQSDSLSGSAPWRAVPRFDFLGGEGGQGKRAVRTEGRVSLAGSLGERIHGTQGDRSWDAEKSLVRSRAMESPYHWPRMDTMASGPRWLLYFIPADTASPFDCATLIRIIRIIHGKVGRWANCWTGVCW